MKDEQLLALLERKANYDTRTLADILQSDEQSVLNKLSELQQERIICGYHTIINWNKTNTEKVAAVIFADATPEREFGYDRIAKKIYQYPEVESMHLMSGRNDFIMRINGYSMKEIADFVATKLACIDGITATSTLIVLQTYKSNGFIFQEDEEKHERLVVTP